MLEKHKAIRWISDNYARLLPLFSLIILFIVYSFTIRGFLQFDSLMLILTHASYMGLLAIGLTFCLAIDALDLSLGSMVSLAGVMAAAVMNYDSSTWLAILVPLLLGALIGLINGVLVAVVKIDAMIGTLAIGAVLGGVANRISGGESMPLVVKGDTPFNFIGNGSIFSVPVPVVIMVVVALLSWFVLSKFRIGQHLYAVGGNLKAAIESGVNVKKIVFLSFMVAGTLAGLVGIIITGRIGSGSPVVGPAYSMDAFAATFIGMAMYNGQPRIGGTFVGILLMTLIVDGLTLLGVNPFVQDIIRGSIMLLVVGITSRKRIASHKQSRKVKKRAITAS